MKLTVVLAVALAAAPALRATEKTGVMKPKVAPYWVKIDSVETTRPGHVECYVYNQKGGGYVPPKPSYTMKVHLSYSVPTDSLPTGSLFWAGVETAAVGDILKVSGGRYAIPKGSTNLVANVFFDCDQCPTGKSSFTVDRMRAIVGTEGVNITTQVSSQVSTQVLPAHLIVDCPATGPEVQRPFSPTPAGQPHPVSPGDAVQKKK